MRGPSSGTSAQHRPRSPVSQTGDRDDHGGVGPRLRLAPNLQGGGDSAVSREEEESGTCCLPDSGAIGMRETVIRLMVTNEMVGVILAQGGSYRLLTPAEVADWLKVSELTIKNKYRAWGLRPQKVGRLLRFRERDVVAYLERKYG
ncbi:helix-turn-helix domain-containing protein [Streptomyces albogriseolus]|uniref:helix-turn-helix domain-containing protein n=2 Tax=Streptomyces albogriseolus TaxID=1887 RepID=UPI0037FF4118